MEKKHRGSFTGGLGFVLPPQEVLSDSEICGGSLIWLHSTAVAFLS